MEPTPSGRRALGAAVLAWAGSMVVLALGGLATGVWHLSDLWGRAGAAFVGEFGLLATVGTFLLVGGPVYAWQRYGLVAPLLGLGCYVAYAAYVGVSTEVGFSALYVAVMYAPLGLVVLALLAPLEWALRRVRPARGHSTG